MKKKGLPPQTPLWQIFIIVLLFMIFIEAAQAFRVRGMYMEKQRLLVMHTLQRFADEEGWFLSDLSPTRIDKRQMEFMHETHHRGYDESVCYKSRYSETSPAIRCHAF
jgi:hypothetical protein